MENKDLLEYENIGRKIKRSDKYLLQCFLHLLLFFRIPYANKIRRYLE